MARINKPPIVPNMIARTLLRDVGETSDPDDTEDGVGKGRPVVGGDESLSNLGCDGLKVSVNELSATYE